MAGWLLVLGCGSEAMGSAGEATSTQDDVPAQRPTSLSPDGCAPISAGSGLERIRAVACGYALDVASDCQTAGLTRSLSAAHRRLWISYLIEYTSVMASCLLDGQPLDEPLLESGGAVFGLANTSFVGASRGALGRDDVERLMTFYMARFGAILALTADERRALEGVLWDAAANDLDPRVSSTLSICPRGRGT